MCGNDQSTNPSEVPTDVSTDEATPQASSCCGTTTSSTAAVATEPAAADLAECPVMPGNFVVKATAEAAGLFRDHEGTRYWFCCAGCGPRWDADPASYVAA